MEIEQANIKLQFDIATSLGVKAFAEEHIKTREECDEVIERWKDDFESLNAKEERLREAFKSELANMGYDVENLDPSDYGDCHEADTVAAEARTYWELWTGLESYRNSTFDETADNTSFKP